MSKSIGPLDQVTRALAALLLLLVSFGALAGTAAAETPPPGPELTEKAFEEADLFNFGLLGLNLFPSAEVTVNCETNTIDVRVGNPTEDWISTEVWVDGAVFGSGLAAPGQQVLVSIAASENEEFHLEVSVITQGLLFDDDVKFDCVFPAPEYDVLSDCETGQAHARLVNNGDDTAYIGIQYPDVMHMEIEIAPHSSENWLLAVDPGEVVEFDVTASNVAIGSEILDFVCESPVEPTPEPTDEVVVAEPADQGGDESDEPVESEDDVDEPQTVAEADVEDPTDDQASDNDEDGVAKAAVDEEVAAGPNVVAGGQGGSGKGTGTALVLIGLGLAVLAAVAVFTTRNHT